MNDLLVLAALPQLELLLDKEKSVSVLLKNMIAKDLSSILTMYTIFQIVLTTLSTPLV